MNVTFLNNRMWYRVVKGHEWEALVLLGDGVGRVDVTVAGEAERRGIGLTGDVGG